MLSHIVILTDSKHLVLKVESKIGRPDDIKDARVSYINL